jgi:hypothetical protein
MWNGIEKDGVLTAGHMDTEDMDNWLYEWIY